MTKPFKKSRNGKFIQGASLSWLSDFVRIGGSRAALLSLVLKTLSELNQSDTFALETPWYEAVGLHRNSLRRLLKRCSDAGLIKVEYETGRRRIITLISVDRQDEKN